MEGASKEESGTDGNGKETCVCAVVTIEALGEALLRRLSTGPPLSEHDQWVYTDLREQCLRKRGEG
jgi:hypothetical protein